MCQRGLVSVRCRVPFTASFPSTRVDGSVQLPVGGRQARHGRATHARALVPLERRAPDIAFCCSPIAASSQRRPE
eukprot:1088497-Prymnesium_polylepis.1